MSRKSDFPHFLAINAMLSAMCFCLASLAVSTNNFKITFESFPVILGALLGGPISGMLIGGTGTFIYQMLRYGFTLTTPLWILPFVVAGGIAGAFATSKKYSLSRRETMFIAILSELVITGLNTLAIYVDSHIYGYYYPAIITGMIVFRTVISLLKGLVFGSLLPIIIRQVKKILG